MNSIITIVHATKKPAKMAGFFTLQYVRLLPRVWEKATVFSDARMSVGTLPRVWEKAKI